MLSKHRTTGSQDKQARRFEILREVFGISCVPWSLIEGFVTNAAFGARDLQISSLLPEVRAVENDHPSQHGPDTTDCEP